ncbi:MAG: hypothetical protein P8010_06885 [Desulfosarcinaceae bacterium]
MDLDLEPIGKRIGLVRHADDGHQFGQHLFAHLIVTRHGSPVAIMQPADRSKQVDVAAVIRKMRSFRKAHHLGGLSVQDMIEEGRK